MKLLYLKCEHWTVEDRETEKGSDTDKQPVHVVMEDLGAQNKKTQARPSQKSNWQVLRGRGFSNYTAMHNWN